MYDVSSLSPEEKDRLLAKLIEVSGIEPSGSSDVHPDESQDLAMLEPFAKVAEMLIGKMEQLEEQVEALDKLVTEEIIGGITSLYKEKSRMGGISSMMEKYKDKFDPYQDFYKETAGSSLYDDLYDEIEKMKEAEPDWNEEKECGKVDELFNGLKEHHGKIKGIVAPDDGIAIKVETKEAEQEADPLEKVKAMRKKFGDRTLG